MKNVECKYKGMVIRNLPYGQCCIRSCVRVTSPAPKKHLREQVLFLSKVADPYRLRVILSGDKYPGGMFVAVEPDHREGNAAGVGIF